MSKNVNLLIHDSTFLSSSDAEKYNHSTPDEAAKVARDANVEKLVLTHLSQRHKNTEEFITQAKIYFDNVVVAEDLMEIELEH